MASNDRRLAHNERTNGLQVVGRQEPSLELADKIGGVRRRRPDAALLTSADERLRSSRTTKIGFIAMIWPTSRQNGPTTQQAAVAEKKAATPPVPPPPLPLPPPSTLRGLPPPLPNDESWRRMRRTRKQGGERGGERGGR